MRRFLNCSKLLHIPDAIELMADNTGENALCLSFGPPVHHRPGLPVRANHPQAHGIQSCWSKLRKILGVQRRVSAIELIDAFFTGTLIQFLATISWATASFDQIGAFKTFHFSVLNCKNINQIEIALSKERRIREPFYHLVKGRSFLHSFALRKINRDCCNELVPEQNPGR